MGDALVPDLNETRRERDALELEREQRSGHRGWLPLLGGLCLLTVAFLIYREHRSDRPYRVHQLRYQELRGSGHRVQPGIRQIVLGDRTDRCPSCHLGIAEPMAGPAPANPHRAHPGGLLRTHPPRLFGCTLCHGAGGEYLDRCLPASGDPDGRALGRSRAQASCLTCHRQAEALPGAEQLTSGLRAYRRLGCAGCHTAQRLAPDRRIGPVLDGVAGKLQPGAMRELLEDPQRARPGTVMPSFFGDQALSGAPDFTLALHRRERHEAVEELVAFLSTLSARQAAPGNAPASISSPELVATGQALFAKLGCLACHRNAAVRSGVDAPGLGGVGPDLSRARERLTAGWTASWLAGPRAVFPETRMPDFRLEDDERAALAALLGGASSGAAASASPAERALRGRARAERLGCPGCHQLTSLRESPPAGPELDGFGDKTLELLDWGHAPVPQAERTTWRWTELKLTAPLTFDRRPGVLAMPWQSLRPGELQGLSLLLRSLVSREPATGLLAQASERASRVRRGERIVEEYGCRQCHSVARVGGHIAALYPLASDRPPALEGEGQKTQPAWLFGYLARPEPLRPWLGLRMPTPAMGRAERESVVAYFSAEGTADYPFLDPQSRALAAQPLKDALHLFERFQCLRCHLLSNAPKLKPGELSPDLSLSGARLRRDWIRRFILDPQALMPGTQMPTLFPLTDEDDPSSRMTPVPDRLGGSVDRQIDVLTDLNLWWGSVEAARTPAVTGASPR